MICIPKLKLTDSLMNIMMFFPLNVNNPLSNIRLGLRKRKCPPAVFVGQSHASMPALLTYHTC